MAAITDVRVGWTLISDGAGWCCWCCSETGFWLLSSITLIISMALDIHVYYLNIEKQPVSCFWLIRESRSTLAMSKTVETVSMHKVDALR